MRVVEVTAYGGPEVLRMARRPEPEAGEVPGRVRVRLKATSVNQADLKIRSGRFAAAIGGLAPPFILGFDFAGRLLDSVPGLPEGTRVAGFIPWLDELTGEGAYAEVIRVDPSWLAPVPDEVDFPTAASVPLSSLTAAQAVDLLELPAGSPVLITGASGVVGRFALQHAAAAGLRVAVLADEGDEAELGLLGAEAVVTRGAPEEVVTKVLAFAPERLHGIFDAALIGDPLLPALKDGGIFVTASAERSPAPEREIDVKAVHGTPDGPRLKRMLEKVAARELATRMADVLPLEEVAEAHRRAEAGHRPGRIVLLI
ncbi:MULTISPECIES: NADP-dependent oxidoreductase [unclassified Streptomyces]|uniref:NADP-dependent oxidoreductase n=1 Tax=unclassified Streptomyces TaxID=2593676 RepID=UPI00166037DE|nr:MULTISPECIES: NADP-dependent oxidoreductase [unclassified Streptomyces]MBD0712057.1 zinc-binding alcohol dehydrogenase [Streptomyces sp. CBMA291]MBD0717958.1 zinc-binding alcohol dehydrogenase [Streptomyces sp. CBMA370]